MVSELGLNCVCVVCVCVCVYVCICVLPCLDTASFLLYNLVDSMTEAEVRAHETKLQEYFNKLSEQVPTQTQYTTVLLL